MGTEVHSKSYLPGYYSMRDLNEDANSSSWPLYYGDKTLTNGQYYHGFMPRTVTDAHPGHDRDAVKQKMLEHEAIFKNQVFELHRLYRIQRDMMEEVKKKEHHTHRISNETSSGSSLIASQMPFEDAWKWHIPSFPLANSGYAKPYMLGANIFNSPLGCTKGNSTQSGRGLSQNGCTSKDCEVMESRPSKVRKKLFDLQLPADEYIDTEEGEQIQENKISDISSHPLDKNHEAACRNNVKLFLGGGGRTNYQVDASTSVSYLGSSIGLADLNEPIQAEVVTGQTSVDFCVRSACHGQIRGPDLSGNCKSEFLGLPKELMRNSDHGSNNGTLNNPSVKNKSNGSGWSSNIYESGKNKSSLTSIPQGLQQEKLPMATHPMQVVLDKAHQLPGVFPNDHSREDLWRDRTGHGLDIFDRNHTVASHTPNPYPFLNSADVVNSQPHSASIWGKPISSLTQKLASVHTHPSLNSSSTLSRSFQSSSHDICGEKWHVNGSYRSNQGLRSDLQARNGFYHGSLSGYKELSVCSPSVRIDYQNCNRDDNLTSGRTLDHGSEKFFNGSHLVDIKSARDMKLNVALSKSPSNEAVSQQDLEMVDEKQQCGDHLAALPWLRAKATCKDVTNSRRDLRAENLGFSCRSEAVRDLNRIFPEDVVSVISDHGIEAKKETSDSLSNRKILGFPIFQYPCASKNESLSLVSTSASLRCPSEGGPVNNQEKNRLIDINLACDPSLPESGKQFAAGAVVVEKAMDTTNTCFRSHIDLNSCMNGDEIFVAPSVARSNAIEKITVEIDLEAPAVPETEEDILPVEEQKQHQAPLQSSEYKAGQPQEELVRIAAEAIVSISSLGQHDHKEDITCYPSEASLAESLLWFVEVVSCADDLELKSGKKMTGSDGGDVEDSSSDEIDYFEAMTLQLTETKEEDYMPKPFVPEIQKVEETGATSLRNRQRKGQTRRGRQRRDFQRDILPGLVSLSRHEVTEDIQIFGGLMRATGHYWNSGLTRRNGTRNGAARGRRRSLVDTAPSVVTSPVCTPLMQHLNNIGAGLEDRSLTGWGKTTRRPRRQRCPAGNPPSVPLT
ncbi:unnamed protein product [Ilex paraguariensis]|uniref:Uncharacterized protein n=1 Tax=Ilex paraguariensis TaxID=185542 RepID=A0ABC8RBN1_9AQUA